VIGDDFWPIAWEISSESEVKSLEALSASLSEIATCGWSQLAGGSSL
jgi:hypothetical protein